MSMLNTSSNAEFDMDLAFDAPAFEYAAFKEAVTTDGKCRILKESKSSDGKLRVITYAKDNFLPDDVRPFVFVSRMFREGFPPDDGASYELHPTTLHAYREHDSLVARYMEVFNTAPALVDGAL